MSMLRRTPPASMLVRVVQVPEESEHVERERPPELVVMIMIWRSTKALKRNESWRSRSARLLHGRRPKKIHKAQKNTTLPMVVSNACDGSRSLLALRSHAAECADVAFAGELILHEHHVEEQAVLSPSLERRLEDRSEMRKRYAGGGGRGGGAVVGCYSKRSLRRGAWRVGGGRAVVGGL